MGVRDKALALIKQFGAPAKFGAKLILQALLPGSPAVVELVGQVLDCVHETVKDGAESGSAKLPAASQADLQRVEGVLDILQGEFQTILAQLAHLEKMPDVAAQILDAALLTDQRCRDASNKLDHLVRGFDRLEQQNEKLLQGQGLTLDTLNEILPLMQRLVGVADFVEELRSEGITPAEFGQHLRAFRQGARAYGAGQIKEAKEQLRRVSQLHPRSAAAAAGLAAAEAATGDLRAAQQSLGRATRLQTGDPECNQLQRRLTRLVLGQADDEPTGSSSRLPLRVCPRCSRRNPLQAVFCYYDGTVLDATAARGGPLDVAREPFHHPFTFPAGRRCHNFDELAIACQEEWDTACGVLKEGYLESFLGGLGRVDLALAAKEAARFPDTERGLDQLLTRLPSQVLQPPKLVVEPGQLNLGTMQPGQDSQFQLRLYNQGMGLLHGTISCADCPWLSLGEPGSGMYKKLFQFLHDSHLQVSVCGKSLRAGNKPQQGKIVIESSGGTFTVVVTIDVPIQPFPEGVLAGATTPRKIAEKAKQHPKDAVILFAKGEVARWYASNNWTYPVTEPSASGLAAVQQFFEALGLTTPPKVGINVADVRMEGRGGDIVRSAVQVSSQEKRPVYAHAVSDQPWLEVNDVALDGRVATINLRVPEVPNRPGETLRAQVKITANGRQRFVVPVSLTVTGAGGGTSLWYSSRNGQVTGPFTPEQLQALAKEGKLLPDDMVAEAGAKQWVPASTIGGLVFPKLLPPCPADLGFRCPFCHFVNEAGTLFCERCTSDGSNI